MAADEGAAPGQGDRLPEAETPETELPEGPVSGEGHEAADEVVDDPHPEGVVHHQAGEPFVDGTPAPSGLEAERDEYREAFLRVKADFENYKKRQTKEQQSAGERAARSLAEVLLPVLDACDAAIGQGAEEVAPIASALLEALGRSGLERLDQPGAPFDPNVHEAVLREEGDGDEQVVAEVLRPGYLWAGALLRAAMVKVRG